MTTTGRTTSCSAKRRIARGSERRTEVSSTCILRPTVSSTDSGVFCMFTTAGSLWRYVRRDEHRRPAMHLQGHPAGRLTHRCPATGWGRSAPPERVGRIRPSSRSECSMGWPPGDNGRCPLRRKLPREGACPARHATTSHGVHLDDSAAERCLPAHPTLAGGVRTDRTQEVDAPEVRPVGLAEVELRVRALPEQEAAESLLARGADH